LVLISVRGRVNPKAIVLLEELGELKNSNDLLGIRTRDFSAYSIAPQLTTLSRPHPYIFVFTKRVLKPKKILWNIVDDVQNRCWIELA
jgi:hypothetical protein